MKKSWKIISILFALIAIIALLPTTILAAEETKENDNITAKQTVTVNNSDGSITVKLTVEVAGDSDVSDIELHNEIPNGYGIKAGYSDKGKYELSKGPLVTVFEKNVNPETGDNNIGVILLFAGLGLLSLALIFGIVFGKIKHKNITTFLA